MSVTNIFNNSSIKAIFFGIAFFAIKSFLYKEDRKKASKWFLYLVCFSVLVFIITLNSRIVCFAILLILIIENIKLIRKFRFLMLMSISIITITIAFIFFCKYNSSMGRLLIYKIDWLIIKKHWLLGIGDNFSVIYNHELANYFKNGNGSLQEKLLADNTFFAFNEWLALLIRYGIVVFVLFFFSTFILAIYAVKQITKKKDCLEASVILFLLIVALVTYPSAFYFFRLCFICAALVLVFEFISTHKLIFKLQLNKIQFFLLGIIIVLFAMKEIQLQKNEERNKEIWNLLKNGQINDGLSKALTQYETRGNDGELCIQISKFYFQKNKLDSAIYFVEKAHEKICMDDLHVYWGDCLMESKKTKEAEKHFLMAANIVPHRFLNKIKLTEYYLSVSEYASARKTAEEIIIFPEKIPSKRVERIKIQARQIIDSLERKGVR